MKGKFYILSCYEMKGNCIIVKVNHFATHITIDVKLFEILSLLAWNIKFIFLIPYALSLLLLIFFLSDSYDVCLYMFSRLLYYECELFFHVKINYFCFLVGKSFFRNWSAFNISGSSQFFSHRTLEDV